MELLNKFSDRGDVFVGWRSGEYGRRTRCEVIWQCRICGIPLNGKRYTIAEDCPPKDERDRIAAEIKAENRARILAEPKDRDYGDNSIDLHEYRVKICR